MDERGHDTAVTGAGAANELTARWAEAMASGDDAVFSGVGVWVLLAMLAAGADGPARDELEAAVAMAGGESQAEAGRVLAVLDASPSVRAALGVWTSTVFDPEWSGGLPSGAVGELTGNPGADQARLDGWVAEQTGGELQHLPIFLAPDTRMVLASALTVRTEWQERSRPARPPSPGARGRATRSPNSRSRPPTWLA